MASNMHDQSSKDLYILQAGRRSTSEIRSQHATFSLNIFSHREKVNIMLYIAGIMLYKLGLEAFNGSIISLALSRYERDASLSSTISRASGKVGLLTALNQASQCIGNLLIAPLMLRFPVSSLLAFIVFLFCLLTSMLLIIEGKSGGSFRPNDAADNDFSYYGKFPTDIIIPIYTFAGIVYGMMDTIRRVIPRDIVGQDMQKLRRMDALVHIFYEVSGTGGAIFTALILIPKFGNNFSYIITPPCFFMAALIWICLPIDHFQPVKKSKVKRSCLSYFMDPFILFFKSFWMGLKLVCTSRNHIWLIPGYSFALYAHRFLESNIAPAIAFRYLGHSTWAQIMCGGSNIGELIGAALVFILTNRVRTPLPWLRLDAMLLFGVWWLPFWYPARSDIRWAWLAAGAFVPISVAWAAGDVSLNAYILGNLEKVDENEFWLRAVAQSEIRENVQGEGRQAENGQREQVQVQIEEVRVEEGEVKEGRGEEDQQEQPQTEDAPSKNEISDLGAVMGFLNTIYVASYAISSTLTGRYLDKVFWENNGDIHDGILYIGGVQFSVLACVIFLSTLVPKESFVCNPKVLLDEEKGEAMQGIEMR